jgi:tetratricopeptide (TPR) repeat protein
VLRSDGNYDGAAAELHTVLKQYPRDRVVLNDLGRVLFLQRRFADAVKVLNSVLAIDPEDLQAHYNLMLCYNGLGDEKNAHDHQLRYLRFKADEASQTITGPYRQAHPEDNNERQAIHEHISVALAELKATSKGANSKRQAMTRANTHQAARSAAVHQSSNGAMN